jgi:hypothetical protein
MTGACVLHLTQRTAIATLMAFAPFSAVAEETQDKPVSRSQITEDLRSYYGAEKTTTFVMMAFGGASVAAGVVLVTRPSDFPRGLGLSAITLGALYGIGALTYLFTVNSEISFWSASLEKDPVGFQRDELAHIQGTTSRFFYYRAGELAVLLAGVGVGIYGFASGRPLWQGVGIGGAVEAATLFVVDTFGNRRALDYQDQLGRFQPTLALLDGTGRAWSVGLAGSF